MKILFTGGGTGGHFYPIIAIAESINKIVKEKRLIPPTLYYMADEPYDSRALFDNGITFVRMPAGKMRHYFSLLNVTDTFKTAFGVLKSLWKIFRIYPDVIFGKGGYASFPALVAAKVFRIPVVIHESDSIPGRVNLWAGKFARDIAVSFPEAARFFPNGRTAFTGNPLRAEILKPDSSGAHEFLKLEESTPTILILGGSQGSRIINESILEVLPDLVEKYQIIHQTGKANFSEISKTAGVILTKSSHKDRYKPFDYLNDLGMKMSAGASSLVVSRAGSTIFEIAAWGLPSIIIPLGEEVSHDQTENAFNYARSGSAVVIEEVNLTPHILLSEIDNLFSNPGKMSRMGENAKGFSRLDAADVIALKLLEIGLSHEV
ncbi:MAG: UDP-N-acetylglucosamine--N-acetylmuramyl-(pentapeptide) pyrophosphoryl-undecaprenol N-acetylglucosamine transferase [Candidatus Taylorbacteria bacterium]|nr:UDP-N-acetylglucosamine--N-acetylmuramyl-(pentapeptide) pyrophosphoryl-undecaprenol N-acetylglucosamine transferase [Candidatus Taylorbacteria bacterium]